MVHATERQEMRARRSALLILTSGIIAGCTANARLDINSDKPPPTHDHLQSEQWSPQPARTPDHSYSKNVPPPDLPPALQPRKLSGRLSDELQSTDRHGWSAVRPGDEGAGDGLVHVVRHGDTLTAIAKRHGVTVPMLYAANGLLNDRLTPGQHLVIPTTR